MSRKGSLQWRFCGWIVTGLIAFLVGPIFVHESLCPPQSGRIFPPVWLCGEAKFTDIALVFFTYCLVIVGWFGIRSSERASRNLERAYIFAGPYRPTWNGSVTITQIQIGNFGRSPAIIKEAYAEFSATEPTAKKPVYNHGSRKLVDSAVAPGKEDEIFPTRWTSPIQGDHYFFGYVRYLDIFREEHYCRFCAKIFPQESKSDIAGPPAWNDWD